MADDHMHGMSAPRLLRMILKELEHSSALGIVKELFFSAREDDPFRLERYGVILETPLGVAAGPHTQMAQNIVAAWLTGARYIELKTVQVLDQISVAKPCIDMADEGYNCEWSQELSLDQSYDEYLKAWVLLHVLHDYFGGKGAPGMIFNMSAGYSMEGILSPTVQRFLDRMGDCAADVEKLKKELAPIYPRVKDLHIPGRMSDNLTISCMHGCPPDEVGRIALYFIEGRGYHTTLKMNPTLLGPERVRGILNDTLGYETVVPDIAFGHDLPYDTAMGILKNCLAAAEKKGVCFSVKLTNTLETENHKQNLPDKEKTVYMSGRPLHPISISLAAKLQKEFGGALDISFCAGVDALNVADTLAGGLAPVTVCSDLLKPGGYGRLAQYVENLRAAMSTAGAKSLDGFVCKRAGSSDRWAAAIKNLEAYAARITAKGSRYSKVAGNKPDVKTERSLPALDCAAAPCKTACPAGQDVPGYMARAAAGDPAGTLAVILATNPLPNVLGKMCNQACRSKCMRAHYDDPLRIRDVKRCTAEMGASGLTPATANGRSVAVIGAGPAGLTCAWFLALAGCSVNVYEAGDKPGGRVLGKMAKEAERVERDVRNILDMGVKLHLNKAVNQAELAVLAARNDAVYAAVDEPLSTAGFSGKVLQRIVAPGKTPGLVDSVGEGRRAAGVLLARLGLLAADLAPAKAGTDARSLRKRQAFRYAETAKSVDAANVREEAARCLQCDEYCGICASVCPNRANLLLPSSSRTWPVQEAVADRDGVRVITLGTAKAESPWQVLNLGDFCNECGNCAAFCPSAGAPYRDKIRLHLSRASFEAASHGFCRTAEGRFEGKRRGEPWSLRKNGGTYVYEDTRLRAELDAQSLNALSVELRDGLAAASLAEAAQAVVFCEFAADAAAPYIE